jgi:hypothetical protein
MNIFKDLKPLFKLIPSILKVFPLVIKAILFVLVTIPQFITTLTKKIVNYGKKALPIGLAISIAYILIFFGLQILITKLVGVPGIIPQLPLAIFTLFIIISLIEQNLSMLKIFQKYIIVGFMYIFTNPLIKDIVGFDVEIDKKHPEKSIKEIIEWIIKNAVKVILILIILGFLIKISFIKAWSYITFYSSTSD